MDLNFDLAIETVLQIENELRALPQRRKAMTEAEQDQKLGDLATAVGNIAETLKDIRRKAKEPKECS